ncbi:MAG: clostripain-related cysteine peptidase [Candidatus Eremiobacteraeota bacterium]|nr:clostripain-related cysteine peptidase [Candidatus Eremiobacteraeota bacterium]
MDSIQRAAASQPMVNLGTPSQVEKKEEQPAQAGDSVQLGKSRQNEQPKAKWLIMNYVAADCNLEPYQVRNVDNMELAGSDPTTHILTQLDRGRNPSDIDGGWANCRRLYVTKDEVPDQLGSKTLQDMGAVDMSNPKTLTDFIVWGVKNYPAQNVALILNDHGGGFTGAMADDSDGGFMSTPQLKQALADAEAITGKKIDIVGFDACLMAEAEVAHELKDNANILLASEESESGPGWTYSPMLGGKTLTEALERMRLMKLDATPAEFAKIVVDVNKQHNDDIPTFSALDLTKMNEFTGSANTLAEAIIASKDKTAIKSAIKTAENYGSGYTPYKDLRDAYDMADKIVKSKSITDENVKNAAKGMMEAVNTMVIANESNPQSYPDSHGISIYTPTTVGASGPGYGYKNLGFAKDTKWDEMLSSLKGDTGAMQQPEEVTIWPDGSMRPHNK